MKGSISVNMRLLNTTVKMVNDIGKRQGLLNSNGEVIKTKVVVRGISLLDTISKAMAKGHSILVDDGKEQKKLTFID